MPPTTAISVVSLYSGKPYDIYCGRGFDPNTLRVPSIEGWDGGYQSGWGNLFSTVPGSLAPYKAKSKLDAIRKHETYIREHPEIVERIKRVLRGKVLMCHCSEKDINNRMCHACTLARIADED